MPVGVNVNDQTISPDGKWLLVTAVAENQQNLYVYPLDELSRDPAVARQLTSTPGGKRSAQFTPDSKEVLTGSFGRAINRWEATTGRKTGQLTGPNTMWNSNFALSPDGKTLAAVGKELAIHLLDAKTGVQSVKFTKHLPPNTSAVTNQYGTHANPKCVTRMSIFRGLICSPTTSSASCFQRVVISAFFDS